MINQRSTCDKILTMKHVQPISTIAGLAWLSFALTLAPRALAADFLMPGIQAKAAAGAGQTVSRGATSMYFNPANLSTTRGVQPEIDLSMAQITYTYQNADTGSYVPAVLTATTPLASFGLAWKPIPQLALGVAMLPLGNGTAQVDNGVPAQITPGTIEASNVTRNQTAFRAAVGSSVQFNKMFAIGVSLLYYSDQSKVSLVKSGTDRVTLNADYKGTSKQYVVGTRLNLPHSVTIGLSYKTAVTRTYTGSLDVNTASSNATEPVFQNQDFKGVGFDPAQIGFGIEGRIGYFGAFFDFVRENWSAGRSIYKQGLGTDGDATDFIDTNDITVGARVWLTPKHRLEAAFGMDGGNMRAGDPVDSTSTKFPSVRGVRIGQLEAVPRNIYSGGYRYSMGRSSYIELAAVYMYGALLVPDGFYQPGTFSLKVIMGSAGISYSF